MAQWQMGFPGSEMVKSPPASAGSTNDVGLIPGLGISPAVGNVTHSSNFAWKTPWTEEPGALQFMGVTKRQIGLSTITTINFNV